MVGLIIIVEATAVEVITEEALEDKAEVNFRLIVFAERTFPFILYQILTTYNMEAFNYLQGMDSTTEVSAVEVEVQTTSAAEVVVV